MNTIIRAKQLLVICLLLLTAACGADADKDIAKADCHTLVAETGAACMDMIQHGLDVSCKKYLMAIDMAYDQANGDLFDTGKANKSTADALCKVYVGKLRKDRKAHDADMSKGAVGPKCSAAADKFKSKCLPTLGKNGVSKECKGIARAFMYVGTSSQVSQEDQCAIATQGF